MPAEAGEQRTQGFSQAAATHERISAAWALAQTRFAWGRMLNAFCLGQRATLSVATLGFFVLALDAQILSDRLASRSEVGSR
jgi:hypothetical protein